KPVVGEPEEWVKSVCRFCCTGCGVLLGLHQGQLVALRGDPDHPTTKGLVCAKALFLPKIVYAPDWLTKPLIRKNGELVEASWEEAMTLVADKFAEAIKAHGPDSVAYYGSGQALSEESYLANRLFKGRIGTNSVEGNPRLCTASAVGGYVTTYGHGRPEPGELPGLAIGRVSGGQGGSSPWSAVGFNPPATGARPFPVSKGRAPV
ncbi:MAG: hypothetical protein D6759_12595, partial [Chloroflexi bacterium]